MRWNLDVDVSEILPSIRVPTLVLHRPNIPGPDVRSGRYFASHIPGARLVELPGRNFGPPLGDTEPLFAELEAFLRQVQAGRDRTEREPERVLTTVLFTDIVDA